MGAKASAQSDEEKAGMAPRTVTDLPCLVIFIAFLCGIGYIMAFAFRKGDPRRLTHGFNYRGQLCGVDPVVPDSPLIYWCAGAGPRIDGIPTTLNFEDPICVKSCPTDGTSEEFCPTPSTTMTQVSGTPPLQTTTTIIVRKVVKQLTYKTKPMMNRYCIPDVPKNSTLMKALMSDPSSPMASSSGRILDALGGLRRGGGVLAASIFIAILLGYVYLFCLRTFAKILVYTLFIILIVGTLGLGLAFLSTAWNLTGHQADSPIFKRYDPDTAALISKILGGVCCFIGLGCLVLLICCRKSIDTAIGCIQAACTCMFQMPDMLAQPLIEAVIKLIFFFMLLYGFMWLLSSGRVTADSAMIGGKKVAGVKRKFEYTKRQKYFILYYIFGYFWIMELCNAFGQFCICYSVVLWYYTEKKDGSKVAPRLPLIRAAIAGFVFHLGSLAFGSFLIALCRMAKLIAAYIQKQNEAAGGNPVITAICKALICCVSCFERFLKFVNKTAYIDISISSNSFCTAMKNSFEFILSKAATIGVLNGACFIFQFVGIAAIGFGGGWIAYMILTNVESYTDDASPSYISDPQIVAIVACGISGVIGYGFMNLFDTTADTLLYTFEWNKDKDAGSVSKYAPDDLSDLVASAPTPEQQPLKGGDGGDAKEG